MTNIFLFYHYYQMTTPLFRIGQVVRYNAVKQAEFREYIAQHPGARMPTVPLRISNSYWSQDHNTWMYEYEYDWTSEGYALETDLVAAESATMYPRN